MKRNQSTEIPRQTQIAIDQASIKAALAYAEEMQKKGVALYWEMKEAIANSRKQERLERVARGIAKAKAAGKYQGRPSNPALHRKILMCIRLGMTVRGTAEMVGCSPSTVQRVKKFADSTGNDNPSLATPASIRESIGAGLRALGHN